MSVLIVFIANNSKVVLLEEVGDEAQFGESKRLVGAKEAVGIPSDT